MAGLRWGDTAALGFSCFALKIYYMLGLWDKLSDEKKRSWVDFIISFQKSDNISKGAFIDPIVLHNCDSLKARIARTLYGGCHPGVPHTKATLIAETKQFIATLAQVEIQSPVLFSDFPSSKDELFEYLRIKLNWTRPWGAGGQSAAIALFVANEAPKFLESSEVKELKETMKQFFYSIVDNETGGYFIGKCPDFGQLINGAMKVLNAYEWLKVEIPYCENLIATCLSRLPSPEGCHIVDVMYVLYRCSLQTNYRKKDIMNYCINILEMIKKYCKPDGAFSYYINHNQTNYYGAKIARPMYQSDIHGTALLTFAIRMIAKILEMPITWKYMKT